MLLSEKIEYLNQYVDGTLSFTHYCRWQVSSYRDHSLFNSERTGPLGICARDGETFEQFVDRLYELVLEDERKTITLNGKKYKLVED